ncbi:MAG: DUF4199 domain-containing protein [Bacteroidia bacterium]|nr:DUF4199 domain-containing protein [Bacteroidia bacterium]NND25247.1 DUF4199 domain-containing protein [Flavobacteriaceae bacterium]MBT8277489.1 DUF4199 domain-containing protein [Bacteroidia bacterium]NNK61406.1 DUF4199 domain-containing protein [Flavobacteriaceae bacterium]NNL32799.1 DUF4199 domain-containing protein [Flavobacteriaceae bacterium]
MKNFTLPVRFGIAASGSLIAYFLLLALFDKHTSPIFSMFNAVITGFAIYEAIKYAKLNEGKAFGYVSGFKTGLITGSIATLVFTIFFAFYVTEINPEFYETLMSKVNMDVSVGLLIFSVGILGLATTGILTLTFMQLFKPSQNIS